MFFPDLGKRTQIDDGDHVRAIGWLSGKEPFTTGEVERGFAERLRLLCDNWGKGLEALYWPAAGGLHECELCRKCSMSGNVGIPAGSLLYVFPEMTSHYVDEHHYRPPEEFVRAVMNCPIPGTAPYADAVASFREINEERIRRLLSGK